MDPGDIRKESWNEKMTAGDLEEVEKDAFSINVHEFTKQFK